MSGVLELDEEGYLNLLNTIIVNRLGRAERIIYNEWNVMAVRHLRDCLQIGHITVGIAQRFDKNRLGVGLYRGFIRLGQRVNKRSGHAE